MRAIPILLAALWLAPSAAAQTLPAVQRAVEGEACPIAPYDPDAPEGTLQEPEWWSAPERYAWREICAGNVADMQFSTGTDDGAGCRAFTPDPEDPAQLLEPDAWPESRELRPRFLRQIAARQPFTDAPVRPVVHIACAQMTDRLDLSDETVPQALYIQNSRLPGASIANARFGRDLRFEGSHVDGDLTAWTARMEGALYMRNGRFGAISLLGADVAGNVETDGSTLTGPFNADGLRVGGYVFMRDMPAAAGISLIGGEFEGAVQFHGATLTGRVDLTDAVIGEALELSQGADRDTEWGADASLILRNARAGSLQARIPNSFRAGDKTDLAALVPTDLNGFAYTRLGGNLSGAETDLARIEAGVLVDWLDTLPFPEEPARQGYRPQPYTQLASVLRGMGAEAAAEAVDYARLVHRTETRDEGWLGPVDWLNRWVVGFGVYPERALAWFTGLVLLGWAVARRSPDLRGQGVFKPFFYSLENALPLIDLSGNFADIRHADAPRIANFFHFQKAAGFVLATVLVGALTILGG